MTNLTNTTYSTTNSLSGFNYSEVINLNEIQPLQDLFPEASGVASIITFPDEMPITKPSNYCRWKMNLEKA